MKISLHWTIRPKIPTENNHTPSESSATIREGQRREINSEIKRDEYD